MNNQNNLKEEVKRYIAKCGYDGLDTEMEVEDIARHFAKWEEQQILEKACEWLKEYTDDYFVRDTDDCWLREDDFIKDFKNYMEE